MLVDRDTERGVLDDVLEDAVHGRARVLLLVGDVGVGKSALLGEIAARAAHRARVVGLRAAEHERDVPGAVVSLLVADLADLLPRLRDDTADALRATLREVADPRLPASVLELLASAARPGPLVVLGDDVQWWDPASLEALLFAGRRLSDDGVAVVLACHSSAADGPELETVPRLLVSPLDLESSVELVRRAAPTVVPEVAWNLATALGGHPAALLEAPALLPDRVRTGLLPLPDPVPVGATLSRHWARLLDDLPAHTRAALAVLAADDTRTTDSSDTAWASQGCGREDLVAAEARRIVVLDGQGWHFPSPLVRAAVFSALTAAERRAAHAALAAALEGRGRDASYAHHLAEGMLGPDAGVADELARLAGSLARDGSTSAAADAAEQAARLSPPGPDRSRLLLDAATLALLARDENRAGHLAEQGLALAADRITTARLRRILGISVAHGGDAAGGVALLREAAGALDGRERVGAVVDALVVERLRDDGGSVAGLVNEVGDLDALEPWMCLDVGLALAVVGRWPDAVPLLDRGLREVDPAGPGATEGVVEAWVEAAGARGLESVLDRFRTAANRLRDTGPTARAVSGLAMAVEVAYAEGRWADAAELNGEARALGVALGRFPRRAVGTDLRLAARRGDVDAFDLAEAHLHAAPSDAGRALLLRDTRALRGVLLVSVGDDDAAEPLLRRAAEGAPAGLLVTTAFPTVAVALAETLSRADRSTEAADVAAWAVPRLRAQPSRLARCYAERLLAVGATGGVAEEHLRAAVELGAGAPHAFELARSRLELGRLLRRRRRRADAVEQLAPAHAAFRAMGCAPWEERCLVELSAAGVDVRRAHPSDEAPRLTAQELRVAEAAAEGLSNAAIARRMYLSPKTVELHLTHCYRKLGITGRAQLAAALAPEPSGASATPPRPRW